MLAQDDEDEALSNAQEQALPPSAPPSVPVDNPAPAPGLRKAEAPEAEWGIPPIPWRSQLILTSGWNRQGDGGSTSLFAKSLATQGASYIWQPWFARVNGIVTLTETDTRDAGGKSSGRGVGGELSMNLLPTSRFPLNLGYGQHNTRTESYTSSDHGRIRRFSMDQRYTPAEGGYTANWGYNWNEATTDNAGRNVVNAINGGIGVPMPGDNPQSLSVLGSWRNNRADTGAASDFGSVNATHSIYLEDYVLTINSDAFASKSRLVSNDTLSDSDVMQAGSAFDWVPDDDSPLRLGGSLRAFNTKAMTTNAGNENSNRVSTLNGQLIASYPLDRRWSFGGSLSGLGTWVRNSDNTTTRIGQATASANASWRGDGWQKKLAEWDYGLSYGSGSFASRTYRADAAGLTTQDQIGVSASLGQNLSRSFSIEGHRTPFRLSMSQGYSASRSSEQPTTHTLSHGANGIWQFEAGRDTQLNVNVGASDSRSFGVTDTNFQSLNASLLGNSILSAYSTVNANLGVQFNRQETRGSGQSGGGDWQGSATGGVGYTHARFGEINGLQYSARYNLNLRPPLRRDLGQVDDKAFQVDHQATQSWAWRLGLLGWRLENTFTYDALGTTAASVHLSVTRDFGGVL